MKTRYETKTSLENLLKDSNSKNDDLDDTEIVVVSDTVRQRRARTPSSNSNSPTKEVMNGSATATNNTNTTTKSQVGSREDFVAGQTSQQVLPDLLPPQTFRLAETSALFSQISKNPHKMEMDHSKTEEDSDIPPPKPSKRKSTESSSAQMVEIKAKNIPSDKMSVNISGSSLQPQQGEIVDTVNILESVEPFLPEYVETVQIVDLSEDSDTSMRVNKDSANEAKRSKSKRSLCDSPNTLSKENDLDKDLEVELRPSLPHTSTPILRVEKQRISFDEKRKRVEKERDILRDSEEEGDVQTSGIFKQPKAKRWRQLQMAMEELDNSMAEQEARDSFYNPDKDLSFEVEPLVFSDDEDIPRFSMEMTQPLDSDSDTVKNFIFFKTI